jgi:uncharacterized protein
MQPTTAKSRILTVDALRGVALLGIMLAHFIYWYTAGPLPESVTGKFNDAGTQVASIFTNLFVTGKFFSFFSFLFGLSFFLQMRGLENDPKRFLARYSWRLAILMVIGLLHHAMWMGDILSIYVPLGFVLLLMRKLSNRWVLLLGILFALNFPGRIISLVQLLSGTQASFADFAVLAKQYDAVIRNGSWGELFWFNLQHLSSKFEFQVWSGRLFITLGFFLLGMYTGRQQWFDKGIAVKPLIRKICRRSALIMSIGLAIGLGMFAADAIMKLGWQQNPVAGYIFMTIYDIFNAAMVVFFISGLTLLMMRNRWQAVLYKLVPVGKMALTSYIMQTLFGLLLFYGAGLGLYGKTSPGHNYLIGIAFFFIQVGFSAAWLRYFNYGPLEWLWRSGTYLKWQPLIRKRNSNNERSIEQVPLPEPVVPLSA